MEELPVRAKQYIAAVLVSGVIAAVIAGRSLSLVWEQLPLALVLLALMVAFEFFMIELPKGVNVSLTAAFRLAAIFLLGPSQAIFLTWAAFPIVNGVFRKVRRPWHRVAFNASMHSLITAICGLAYLGLSDSDPQVGNSVYDVVAIGASGVLYLGLNSALVSVVVALAEKLPLRYMWVRNLHTVLPQFVMIMPMGIVFTLLWQSYPWGIALFVLPMAVVHYSFKARTDLERNTEQALVAMADILDKRDELTSRHSERVAEYSSKIARHLGLPEEQVEVITVAARLHDLGKIGINDAILKKPGPLSPEERLDMEKHSEIGANILAGGKLKDKDLEDLPEGLVAEWLDGIDSIKAAMVGDTSYKDDEPDDADP